jgi:hypothetical protein
MADVLPVAPDSPTPGSTGPSRPPLTLESVTATGGEVLPRDVSDNQTITMLPSFSSGSDALGSFPRRDSPGRRGLRPTVGPAA